MPNFFKARAVASRAQALLRLPGGIAADSHLQRSWWSGAKTQAPVTGTWQESTRIPLPELGMGVILVILSHAMAVGDDYSLKRAFVLMCVCGLIVLYGFVRNPYAPFYCYAFVNPLFPSLGSSWALIAGGIFLVLAQRDKTKWEWEFSWPGLAFCLWATASLLWVEEVDLSQKGFLAHTFPAMLLGFTIAGARDQSFRRNLVLMVVCACVIGCGATFWNWYPGKVTEFTVKGRVDSFIQPDTFAAWAVFGLVGALCWAQEGSFPRLRRAFLFAVPLLLLGIGISGYRSSIVAAGIALIAVAVCYKRVMRGIALVAAVCATAGVLYLVEPEMFKPVIGRFGTMQEDRGSDRLDIWYSGLRVFSQSPVVGVGWDGYKAAAERFFRAKYMSHNIYIGALVELGIVGFGLLIWWLSSLLLKAWGSPQRIWLFPLLLAYVVQGLFLHQFFYAYFWLALGLAEGAGAMPEAFRQVCPPSSPRRYGALSPTADNQAGMPLTEGTVAACSPRNTRPKNAS